MWAPKPERAKPSQQAGSEHKWTRNSFGMPAAGAVSLPPPLAAACGGSVGKGACGRPQAQRLWARDPPPPRLLKGTKERVSGVARSGRSCALRREQNDNVSELPSNAISRLLIGAGLVGQISCCGRGAAHVPLPDPPPQAGEGAQVRQKGAPRKGGGAQAPRDARIRVDTWSAAPVRGWMALTQGLSLSIRDATLQNRT
jgi:hypothetical protein